MPVKKIDKPAVSTYADHEVITPTNKLRHAAVAVRAGFHEHEILRSHLPIGDELRDAVVYVKLA